VESECYLKVNGFRTAYSSPQAILASEFSLSFPTPETAEHLDQITNSRLEYTEVHGLGRTIPSWRMVVEAELEKLKRFRQFHRAEDKVVFDDLLDQCRLYASFAGTMASPLKEAPLFMSMLFGQHKRLMELETIVNQARNSKEAHREESLLGFLEGARV